MWPFKDDPNAIRSLPDGLGAIDPVYITYSLINAVADTDDDDTQPASGSDAGASTKDQS